MGEKGENDLCIIPIYYAPLFTNPIKTMNELLQQARDDNADSGRGGWAKLRMFAAELRCNLIQKDALKVQVPRKSLLGSNNSLVLTSNTHSPPPNIKYWPLMA